MLLLKAELWLLLPPDGVGLVSSRSKQEELVLRFGVELCAVWPLKLFSPMALRELCEVMPGVNSVGLSSPVIKGVWLLELLQQAQ